LQRKSIQRRKQGQVYDGRSIQTVDTEHKYKQHVTAEGKQKERKRKRGDLLQEIQIKKRKSKKIVKRREASINVERRRATTDDLLLFSVLKRRERREREREREGKIINNSE